MSKRIRIGVLGVGSIGRNHARICAGLPNADFTAILDANPDASQAISREYGVPVAGRLHLATTACTRGLHRGWLE
jgi:predicted dehydrogenase